MHGFSIMLRVNNIGASPCPAGTDSNCKDVQPSVRKAVGTDSAVTFAGAAVACIFLTSFLC